MKYELEHFGGKPVLVTHLGITEYLDLSPFFSNDAEREIVVSAWIEARQGQYDLQRERLGVALKPLLTALFKDEQDHIDEVIMDLLAFKGSFLSRNVWFKDDCGNFAIFHCEDSHVPVGEVRSEKEVREYFEKGTTEFLAKY